MGWPGFRICYGFQIFYMLAALFRMTLAKTRSLIDAFGKLKGMVFTSKKVSLRVKNNVYSAMVLSVLLHGPAEAWALSRNPTV